MTDTRVSGRAWIPAAHRLPPLARHFSWELPSLLLSMIQHMNRESRRAPASPGPDADPQADGPEIWGNWSSHKCVCHPLARACDSISHHSPSWLRHYSLEVVQHPLRARMCGFGDKVPSITPPFNICCPNPLPRIDALWRQLQSLKWLSVIRTSPLSMSSQCPLPLLLALAYQSHSEIDWSFFLVLVDLWSADGKQEMNLVLHPSSADRYMPIPSSKNRRRGTSISQPQPSQPGLQTPIQPSPAPSYRPLEQVGHLSV